MRRRSGARMLAHLETWRLYTTPYPFMLALAGIGVTRSGAHGWHILIPCIGLTAGWLGAHYMGDLLDRDLDAISKPHRPIPSGRLLPREALVSASALFLALLVLGALGDWQTLPVSAAIIVGSIAYNARFKTLGIYGNLVRGSLGALGLLYGALAWQPGLSWHIVVPALVLLAHDTSSNLVGTLRDADGDSAGHCQTVTVAHGHRFSVIVATSCYAAALAGAASVYWLLGMDNPSYVVALLLSACLGCVAFASLRRPSSLGREKALQAHAILNVERMVLTGGFATYALSAAVLVPVVLACIAVAIGLHYAMRLSHEFGSGDSPSHDPASEGGESHRPPVVPGMM